MYYFKTFAELKRISLEIFGKNAEKYITEGDAVRFFNGKIPEIRDLQEKIGLNIEIFTMISIYYSKIIEKLIKNNLEATFNCVKLEFGDDYIEDFIELSGILPDSREKSEKLLFKIVKREFLDSENSWLRDVLRVYADIVVAELKKDGYGPKDLKKFSSKF